MCDYYIVFIKNVNNSVSREDTRQHSISIDNTIYRYLTEETKSNKTLKKFVVKTQRIPRLSLNI